MKIEQLAKIHATHDLSCALAELVSVACRYTRPTRLSSDRSITGDLAIAAVAFVIQLAIDLAGRDPSQMRELERELIEMLGVGPVQQ